MPHYSNLIAQLQLVVTRISSQVSQQIADNLLVRRSTQDIQKLIYDSKNLIWYPSPKQGCPYLVDECTESSSYEESQHF